MKIELTKSEVELLFRMCQRAELFAQVDIHANTHKLFKEDLQKIKILTNKLSDKK